jgi:hypothetical protein
MIKFACPSCGAGMSAPSNKAGSLANCPGCGQMVQIPAGDASAGSDRERRRRREGPRAFFALVRLFLWGVCFAAIVLSVAAYFMEIEKKIQPIDKAVWSAQALVWIMGSYFLARAFDDSTKSLEELCARLRGRR